MRSAKLKDLISSKISREVVANLDVLREGNCISPVRHIKSLNGQHPERSSVPFFCEMSQSLAGGADTLLPATQPKRGLDRMQELVQYKCDPPWLSCTSYKYPCCELAFSDSFLSDTQQYADSTVREVVDST